MKDYKLTFLPLFEEDLNQIVDYISLQLLNPKAAEDLVDEVYTSIMERLPFAENFEVKKKKKAGDLPYYRIYVKNYVVFYVVKGSTMEVRRLLYSRRNRTELL